MSNEEALSFKCEICGDYSLESRGWNDFLKFCQVCNSQMWHQNTNDPLGKIDYANGDFFSHAYGDYLREEPSHRKNFEKYIDLLLRFKAANEVKKVIEIGSAFGFFLDEVRKKIPQSKLLGFEMDSQARSYSSEQLSLTISADSIEEALINYKKDFEEAEWVVSWAVLEHLSSIYDNIRALSLSLKEGALFAFTTVDSESITARIKKDKWRLYAPPAHLLYPTKKGLIRALKKNNFNVLYSTYIGNFRSLYQYAHVLSPKVARYISDHSAKVSEFPIKFNAFDIILIIAEKNKGER